jgi:DNA-binding MarR family transcriptional regulator
MDAIRRIVRVLREASRETERTLGVSGAQLFVLSRLAHGPRTINELADDTATHQSSVSVVVQRLVERGLASRAVSAADGRRREVSVTTAGRRLLRKAPTAAQERLIAGLKSLPPRRARQLADLLSALVAGMGAGQEPATMFFEETTAPSRPSRRRPPR